MAKGEVMKRLWWVLTVAVVVLVIVPTTALAYTPWPSSPANGAVVPRNAPNGWYPYLQWGSNNPITTYMWQISTSPAEGADGSFQSQVMGNYGSFNKYFNSQSEWPYYYLTAGTYYWHVLDMFDWDSTGFSPWSATYSFTVPAAPTGTLSMALSPTALAWTVTIGDPAPAAKIVTFGCNGPGSYAWRSYNETLPSWVTETQLDQSRCSYAVDPSGLAPGTYTTPMKVEMWNSVNSAPVLGSPYNLPMTLIVRPKTGATSPPGDTTAPTTTSDVKPTYISSASIKLTATDTGSGVASTYYKFDGVPQVAGTSVTTSNVGAHTLVFWSVDKAGNMEAAKSVAFTVASPPATVKASLGTPVAPKAMKRSKTYTVYGSLRPWHPAGTKPVRIYKYRKVDGKWKKTGYVKATAYNYKGYTRYKVKMKLTTKGTWRLRACAPADSGHATTWSTKYDYVKVR